MGAAVSVKGKQCAFVVDIIHHSHSQNTPILHPLHGTTPSLPLLLTLTPTCHPTHPHSSTHSPLHITPLTPTHPHTHPHTSSHSPPLIHTLTPTPPHSPPLIHTLTPTRHNTLTVTHHSASGLQCLDVCRDGKIDELVLRLHHITHKGLEGGEEQVNTDGFLDNQGASRMC